MNNPELNANAKNASADNASDVTAIGSENCLPIGARLAEFEVTGIIGEGGFGIVYLAFDHSLQRTVAIKEYMPAALAARGQEQSVLLRSKRHQETFATGLKSFINEARLLAHFDHSALIKVYRFWEQNKTAYMAMRYYEGRTLKNIVKNDPGLVTEAWLKPMLQSILEALDALYKVQILHRDISPDNIMIQANGEAVLLDFGAARQIIGDLTHELTVILKPGYAPVEQYVDDSSMQQGPWTDIYALSAVVYSAIVKKTPPTSVARMLQDPMEPLQNGSYSGFSKEFLSAIDKGLAIKPQDRPQSIAEFSRLLGVNAAGSENAALPRPAPPVVASIPLANAVNAPAADAHSAPATYRWAPALAAVALAAGIGGYLALNHSPAPAPVAASSPAAAKAFPLETRQNARTAVAASQNLANSEAAGMDKDTNATGLIKLTVKPWGTIFVDGISKGVSPPLKKMVLPEGKHQLKIVNPHFPDYVVEVVVSTKKASSIDYDFSPTRK